MHENTSKTNLLIYQRQYCVTANRQERIWVGGRGVGWWGRGKGIRRERVDPTFYETDCRHWLGPLPYVNSNCFQPSPKMRSCIISMQKLTGGTPEPHWHLYLDWWVFDPSSEWGTMAGEMAKGKEAQTIWPPQSPVPPKFDPIPMRTATE
jgi:hypothetical protein